MYANTIKPSTGPNTAPAGLRSTACKEIDPTCLKSSKPIAAINPARIEATRLTFSRGSRAIIQVNSSQETNHDTNSEITLKIRSNTENSGIPNHLSTADIGAVWVSALNATVAMSTTNVPSIANRSDTLLRTKPGESMRCSHHISVSACRRCDIQPRPAQAAVAIPMTPTDARASMA